jgi:S-adenosylmethionine hydrolase
MVMKKITVTLTVCCVSLMLSFAQSRALVFQSDFGLKDGAVSAMKGVAFSVSGELKIFDITHEIPPYNIWEGAYRLHQAAPYWPAGTVFVSVVDPGVGSARKSVVMKSKTGHFFVTPDNGTLTFISMYLGVDEVRIIDEKINRLPQSNQSYTFHGRDVYAYTGARLAAGVITFAQVGEISAEPPVIFSYQKPMIGNGVITGSIDILDVQYGNVWSNIDQKTLEKINLKYGDKVSIKIFHNNALEYEGSMLYGRTFSDVKKEEPIAYLNSLLNFSLGINEGSFAMKEGVGSGDGWRIEVRK